MVNVLVADELIRSPKLYATFLLWMLSELFERLPEVGDPDKPTLVFFFDEAHLLFTDAPPALLEKIEQVVRLIRSKGVGVYFVTQSPADVPDTVLGQLGNRVQHALRAFTPRDQKAVKTAADTLRPNPKLDIGQRDHRARRRRGARVDARREGQPDGHRARVDCRRRRRASVRSPTPSAPPMREQTTALYGHYEQAVDRESAYEKLKAQDGAGGAGSGRQGWCGRRRRVRRTRRRRRRLADHRRLGQRSCWARPVRAAGITTGWSSRRRRAPRGRWAPASAARSSAARSDRSSAGNASDDSR